MKQRYSAPLLSAVISTRRVLEVASLPVKYSKELAPGARHSLRPSPSASMVKVMVLSIYSEQLRRLLYSDFLKWGVKQLGSTP